METIVTEYVNFGYLWWLVPVILIALYKPILRLAFGMVMIPEDQIGIVVKKFALFGNTQLPDGAIIALNGEAGVQADTLAPGIHWGFWPWQYSVEFENFTTIQEGMVGILEARDGKEMMAGRVLGRKVECNSYQSARAFIEGGGQRGPQIAVLTPGTYRINTQLFSIEEDDALEIPDGQVGIVTTKDGESLPSGEIAGSEVAGHSSFQDGEAFITNGGHKGLQAQVILAGRYYVNPRFATVETVKMTEVPIATVGVVISYVGKQGTDLSGASFKHGNLVSRGEKGVWQDPLDPGKYPINPHTHKVETVPTANVVLNWATGKNESHKLDENLSTIKVRSSDGFTFNLDVSQIIHIPRSDASMVIARFGTVANLVTQVLEPTIGNYFRNAAQNSDVIGFLSKRSERQDEAKVAIDAALKEYNVGAVDTLIGDITPPEELMATLTDRKIAEQRKITFETQQTAETTRREFEKAKAEADTQHNVVKAQRDVEIAEFDAQSAIRKAEGDAKAKELNATAEAMRIRTVGEAEAGKTLAVGEAEAKVIQQKTDAVGAGNFAMIEVGTALANNKIPLVPEIMAGGGSGNGSESSLISVLLANMVRDQMTKATVPAPGAANTVTEITTTPLPSATGNGGGSVPPVVPATGSSTPVTE